MIRINNSRKLQYPQLVTQSFRLTVCAAIVLGWAFLPLSAAAGILQDSTNPTNDTINSKNVRIQKLQESIIEQKVKILHSKKKERNVSAELKAINNKLKSQRQRLISLKKEYAAQELLLDSNQKTLLRTTVEQEAFKPHVEKRLASYYRTGTVSLMNVLFTTKNLPELLTLEEYFRFLLQHDRDAISDYSSSIVELHETRATHDQERQKLLDIMAEVATEEKALADTQRAQKTLLSQISKEKSLYQQAATEIEKAAKDLADTLRQLRIRATPILAATAPIAPKREVIAQPTSPPPTIAKSPEPEKATPVIGPVEKKSKLQTASTGKPKPTATGFVAQKGFLSPPVFGVMLPRAKTMPDGKITRNPGVDILVPTNTPIRAVYDGRVITSGRMRAYGNLLIIDHGQQYYSVISRSHSFYKTEGQHVKKGEIIGHTGDIAATPGKGLHFEIRHGINPVNPLEWINISGMTKKGQ